MAGPVRKIRAGQISCAIWENEVRMDHKSVPMLRATVERRYKDRDDTWKSSGSFSRNEIPLVIWCLGKAFDMMIEDSTNRSDETVKVEPV